jgi:hypothetical protein
VKQAFLFILAIVVINYCQDFNSLYENIEKTYNLSKHKWQFVPIVDFPIDSMKTKKVPNLSKGKIWNKDGIGGIIWYDADTCCIVIKTCNLKHDTTYKFLWFKKSKNYWKIINH